MRGKEDKEREKRVDEEVRKGSKRASGEIDAGRKTKDIGDQLSRRYLRRNINRAEEDHRVRTQSATREAV